MAHVGAQSILGEREAELRAAEQGIDKARFTSVELASNHN